MKYPQVNVKMEDQIENRMKDDQMKRWKSKLEKQKVDLKDIETKKR